MVISLMVGCVLVLRSSTAFVPKRKVKCAETVSLLPRRASGLFAGAQRNPFPPELRTCWVHGIPRRDPEEQE